MSSSSVPVTDTMPDTATNSGTDPVTSTDVAGQNQVRPQVAGPSTTTTTQRRAAVKAASSSSLPEFMSKLSPKLRTSPSIYRVPKQLRDVNRSAYEPEMVTIGPYHYKSFATTEILKLQYVDSLLERIPNKNITNYITSITDIEKMAHNCYASLVSLTETKFTDTLVLDGCFIIELMIKPELLRFFSPVRGSRRILQRDLILLENQIPFVVLSKIFELVEGSGQQMLMNLVLSFFEDVFPGNISSPPMVMRSSWEVKHILDLVYHHWCAPSSHLHSRITIRGSKTTSYQIPSASQLKKANVTFRYKKCDSNTSLFDVDFTNDGVLVMPTLPIDDWTESLLKNLIAYEQFLPIGEPTPVTDYALLLYCLIHTSEDVQILSHCKIIENMMGSNYAVANFVNKLTDKVTLYEDNSMYADIFSRINAHYNKSWNRALASFRQEYFSTPWAFIAFMGAVMLLANAIVQTALSATNTFH